MVVIKPTGQVFRSRVNPVKWLDFVEKAVIKTVSELARFSFHRFKIIFKHQPKNRSQSTKSTKEIRMLC